MKNKLISIFKNDVKIYNFNHLLASISYFLKTVTYYWEVADQKKTLKIWLHHEYFLIEEFVLFNSAII